MTAEPRYSFRRLPIIDGKTAYSVEMPGDFIGRIVAVYGLGRNGESRSTNRYNAYPVRGRGYDVAAYSIGVYSSRAVAADAILDHLEQAGRR